MGKRWASPVQRQIAAKDLPLGHTERKASRKAVEKEYKESWEAERSVKMPFKMLGLKEAEKVARKIWNAFVCPRLVRVYKTDKPYCYCKGRELYLQDPGGLDTMLHELAHAIVHQERLSGVHDQDFLWVVKMVREYARDNWDKLF